MFRAGRWFIALLKRRSSLFATGTLYLVPRVMPLGLVVLLTARAGIAGLGEVALTLSLWQFLLIVADFGVSQWLLTKQTLTTREIWTAVVGRLAVGAAAATAVGVLVFVGVFDMSLGATAALSGALLLSLGQMAFAWELQRGRPRVAAMFVGIEFVLPLVCVFLSPDPVVGLSLTMVSKTALGIVLTVVSLATMPRSRSTIGLGPRAFGLNSSAWALTSVASGTGELAVLSSAGLVVLGGIYRVFQTVASLGSVVGFAALAPLMSKDSRAVSSLGRPMIALGVISGVLLLAGTVPGVILMAGEAGDQQVWLIASAAALAMSAVLNTLAIVPLSAVARERGSKYTFRIGLASSVAYWALIAVFATAGVPLLVAVAPLAASIVGFIGNLLVWRSLRTVDGAT